MLFRSITGSLVEINRCDYKNDHIYYKKIMDMQKDPVALKSPSVLTMLKQSNNQKSNKK